MNKRFAILLGCLLLALAVCWLGLRSANADLRRKLALRMAPENASGGSPHRQDRQSLGRSDCRRCAIDPPVGRVYLLRTFHFEYVRLRHRRGLQ